MVSRETSRRLMPEIMGSAMAVCLYGSVDGTLAAGVCDIDDNSAAGVCVDFGGILTARNCMNGR